MNDPPAINTDLAAKKTHRTGVAIASVDGAPDIVTALATESSNRASASQNPFTMGELGVKIGDGIMKGHEPARRSLLMAPKLVTRDNVASYTG